MFKKLFTLLSTLFVSVGMATAQTTISASNVTDAFNRPIKTASLCFAPVDATNAPTGFRNGTTQVVSTPVCGLVTSGILQPGLVVVPTTAGVYYHITAKNTVTGYVIRDYGMTPITTSTWTLDSYDPNMAVLPVTALRMGSVTTVPPGTGASCNTAGSNPVLLNCSIPKGDTGLQGEIGPQGEQGIQGPPGYTGVTTDGANGLSVAGNVTAGGVLKAGTTVIASGQGVWHRVGVVNYGVGSAIEEPTVIVEGSPQILTGLSTVWKMWYSDGTSTAYAESPDGITWTIYGGSLTPSPVVGGHDRSSVIHVGATYYMYASNHTTGEVAIDEYTSPDGVTWTLAHAGVVTSGMGAWNIGSNTNSSEIYTGGTLYLFVEHTGTGLGLFTSTDFSTFTPVSLLIAQGAGAYCGPTVPYLLNGKWYMWVHDCSTATVHRLTATALTGPWTDALGGSPEIMAEMLDEGIGTSAAQTADPYILEVNGKTYMYYTASQFIAGNYRQATKLVVADMPLAQLVKTNGGTVGGPENWGVLGLRYDWTNKAIDFQNHPLENVGTAAFRDSLSVTGDAGSSSTWGCFVTSGCNNGISGFTVGTANSGTQYTGSLVFDPNGNKGITFTLPRDLSTIGYYFKNHAGTTLMYVEGSSGKITTLNQTLDDGSGNATFYGAGQFKGNNFTIGCDASTGCPNNATLYFKSYNSAITDASISSSFAGNGMTFTVPRDFTGKGYYFQNNAGTTNRLYIESNSGKITTTNQTLDDGSGNASFLGKVTAAITDRGGEKFNVKAYGATGNGTGTNDCTGITAAFAARDAAGGGNVYFPAGDYIVGSSCRMTVVTSGLISGAGACNYDNAITAATRCGTRVSSSDPTGVFLTVAADAVTFRDIGVVNTSIATSGAVLRSAHPSNYLQQMNVESSSCSGYYDCFDAWVGAAWHITKSHMYNFVHCGVDVKNTLMADAGDGQIEGNGFENTATGSGVCYESGAGLRVINNKFVAVVNGLLVNQTGGSGQTYIIGNSIDETYGIGINMIAGYNDTIIANNYIQPAASSGASAIFCGSGSFMVSGGKLGAANGIPNISAAGCSALIGLYRFNPVNVTPNTLAVGTPDYSILQHGDLTLNGDLAVGSQSSTGKITMYSGQAGQVGTITTSFANGTTGGMAFTLPRNLAGFGYNFWNNGQTTKLGYLDSNTGLFTTSGGFATTSGGFNSTITGATNQSSVIKSTTTHAELNIDKGSSGSFAAVEFLDGGVQKFAVGLPGNDSFGIYDRSNGHIPFSLPAGMPTASYTGDSTGPILLMVRTPAARKGTFVCTAGGTITISNVNGAVTSDVVISLNTSGGTISTPPAMKTVTAGTGFTVLCGASDTSTYNYNILN